MNAWKAGRKDEYNNRKEERKASWTEKNKVNPVIWNSDLSLVAYICARVQQNHAYVCKFYVRTICIDLYIFIYINMYIFGPLLPYSYRAIPVWTKIIYTYTSKQCFVPWCAHSCYSGHSLPAIHSRGYVAPWRCLALVFKFALAHRLL